MIFLSIAHTGIAQRKAQSMPPVPDPARIVADPLLDFTNLHKNKVKIDGGERMLRIDLDIDGDGEKEIFLTRESFLDKECENRVYRWDMYKKLGNGSYAVVNQKRSKWGDSLNGKKFDEIVRSQPVVFSPDQLYVGRVKELNAFGLLTMNYGKKHNEITVIAIVWKEGYFEEVNFPNPNSPPAIYHRGDNGISDMPESIASYFASPQKEKAEAVPLAPPPEP